METGGLDLVVRTIRARHRRAASASIWSSALHDRFGRIRDVDRWRVMEVGQGKTPTNESCVMGALCIHDAFRAHARRKIDECRSAFPIQVGQRVNERRT